MNITKVTNSNFVKIVLSLAIAGLIAGLIVAVSSRNAGALFVLQPTLQFDTTTNKVTATVTATASTDGHSVNPATYKWYRYELVDGSRFGCNSGHGGLDAAGLQTAATAAEAAQDTPSSIAVLPVQREVYRFGSGSSIPDVLAGLSDSVINAYIAGTRSGILHICFYAQSQNDTPKPNSKKIPVPIEQMRQEMAARNVGKPDVVAPTGGIPETGPTEDLLLGLFVIGVTASVICVRTLYVHRRRNN